MTGTDTGLNNVMLKARIRQVRTHIMICSTPTNVFVDGQNSDTCYIINLSKRTITLGLE